jgi:Galactose mutarotase-like
MVARLVGCRTARLGGAAYRSSRLPVILVVTVFAACATQEAERDDPARTTATPRADLVEADSLPGTALCPPALDGMPVPDPRDGLIAAAMNSLRVWDERGVQRVAGRPSPAVESRRSAVIVRFPVRGSPRALTVIARGIAPGATSLTLHLPAGWRAARIGFELPLRAGERIYGLGERFGPVDARGEIVDLWAEDRRIDPSRSTSYSPMPLLISSRRYAVLLDTTARARVDVGAAVPSAIRVEVEAGALRWLVIRAADPRQAAAARDSAHRPAAAHPPLGPRRLEEPDRRRTARAGRS